MVSDLLRWPMLWLGRATESASVQHAVFLRSKKNVLFVWTTTARICSAWSNGPRTFYPSSVPVLSAVFITLWVGPEDLRLVELTSRLEQGAFTEVILALSTDVEGEATANYLSDLLSPRGVRVSRLAQGMPAGGGLEHADELTLARAMAGRHRAGGG